MENTVIVNFLQRQFWVNHDSDEIADIGKAVRMFMQKIVQKMYQNPDRTIPPIIQTGSMAERSKVWPLWEEDKDPVLEFDYLAVTPNFFSKQHYEDSSDCKGFVKIYNENHDQNLSTEKVTTDFGNKLYTAFVEICPTEKNSHSVFDNVKTTDGNQISISQVNYNHDKNYDHHGNECSACISMKTGRLSFTRYNTEDCHHIHFQWLSDSKSINPPYIDSEKNIKKRTRCLETVCIEVDFLSGFETERNTQKCFLVPKTCERSAHKDCWKISHCLGEIDKIKSHIRTYMAIKLLFSLLLCPDMNDEFVILSLLESYRLKTAVLIHSKECTKESSVCQAKILDYISKCIRKGKIDHWCEHYPLSIDCIDRKKTSTIVSYIAELYTKNLDNTRISEREEQRRNDILKSIFGTKLSKAIDILCQASAKIPHNIDDNQLFQAFTDIRNSALILQRKWDSTGPYINIEEKQWPIVYAPEYNIRFDCQESQADGKCQMVYKYLLAEKMIQENTVVKPKEATPEDLLVIHSQLYLDGLKETRNIEKILGPANDCTDAEFFEQNVLKPSRYHTGGTILAGKLAINRGWAINLGGGFHHCQAEKPGLFSAYADIHLGLQFMFERFDVVNTALVIDLDVQRGNGINFVNDDRVSSLEIFWSMKDTEEDIKTFVKRGGTFRACVIKDDTEYLNLVESSIQEILTKCAPDVVVYNAGTNQLNGGKLCISNESMIERDYKVFSIIRFRKIPIPIIMLIGGLNTENAQKSAETTARSIINLRNKSLIKCDGAENFQKQHQEESKNTSLPIQSARLEEDQDEFEVI